MALEAALKEAARSKLRRILAHHKLLTARMSKVGIQCLFVRRPTERERRGDATRQNFRELIIQGCALLRTEKTAAEDVCEPGHWRAGLMGWNPSGRFGEDSEARWDALGGKQ